MFHLFNAGYSRSFVLLGFRTSRLHIFSDRCWRARKMNGAFLPSIVALDICFGSFHLLVIMCHGMPPQPRPQIKKKRSRFISIWMAGARARVWRSRPTGHRGKTLLRMTVGGLYSCFNGLHAVYTGLILEQYSTPSTIPPSPSLCALSSLH